MLGKRTSKVDFLDVNSMLFSSILEVGDSSYINSLTRALAVQREEEIFFDEEGNYEKYTVFREPIPLPAITEELYFEQHQLNPIIKVGKIDINAFSSSSILHIGSSKHVYLEARIKHIRQIAAKE